MRSSAVAELDAAVPDGGPDAVPGDELRWHRGRVAVALAVTLVGLGYLSQVLRVSTWDTPWLAALLSVAEVYTVFTVASLAWGVTRRRIRAHRPAPAVPVDVFVPTVNEPVELLEPTLVAALALRHRAPVRVFLLDDGNRPEMAALADRLGVHYLARATNEAAKAGNLNAALQATAGDGVPVFCVFDADQVPDEAFLERTLGHLFQPDVAVVQTPQLYRLDGTRAVRVAHDQQLLIRDRLAPCFDAFGTMMCVGSGFVAKRADVDAVGGFPHALTEDVALTLQLRRLGKRVAYVHEQLSIGLAPPTLDAFVKQQTRWAAGTFQAWSRNLSVVRHLRPIEIWQYLSVPMNWFYGITLPIYLTVAFAGLLFDRQPFVDGPPLLLQAEVVWALVALPTLFTVLRGCLGLDAFLVRWGTFPITFRALRWVLWPRSTRFEVSEKLRRPGQRSGTTPYLVTAAVLAVVIVGVLCSRGLTETMVLPLLLSASNVLALAVFALRQRQSEPSGAPAA